MSDEPAPIRRLGARHLAFTAAALVALAVLIVMMVPRPIVREPEPMDSPAAAEADIPALEQMFREHPDHAPIALQLGNLHAAQGNYDRAMRCYRHFLSIDTSETGWQVRQDLARSLFALGRTDEARAELRWMLERHPQHPGALYNLGAIEANLGNGEDARRLWNELLRAQPDDENAQLAREGLKKLDGNPKP